MTQMLKIDSKGWRVKQQDVVSNDPECPQCTSVTRIPEPNWWSGREPGYGAAVLIARYSGTGSGTVCGGGAKLFTSTLTRLTFTTGDGTEYELRDQIYDGQPQTSFTCPTVSRGTVFTTADGTSATFISDQEIIDHRATNFSYPSGYMMLRDGTRYRIDNGNVSWMRDRNGNQISFTYTSGLLTQITDSLNRQVFIEYDVADVAPYGLCDRITYRGFGSTQRVIRISKTNLVYVLRPSFTAKTFQELFPELDGSGGTPFDETRFSAVWLPDGRSYKFYYNSYGELSRVELPTGGAIEYDYNAGSGCIDEMGSNCTDTLAESRQIFRRVTTRRVYSDGGTTHSGGTLDSKMTFSDPNEGCTYYPCGGDTTVTVNHLSAAGTKMSVEKHYYYGRGADTLWQGATSYPSWKQGREYKTEWHDTASTVTTLKLLRSVENTWAQRTPLPAWIANQASDSQPAYDVRLTQAVTTLWDTGTAPHKLSKQTYTYDQYNNQTKLCEYPYGDGAPGSVPTRCTHTTYLTSNTVGGVSFDYDSDSTIHIRNLPEERWVSTDLAGNQKKAITTYEYDNYTADAVNLHEPLLARTGISGLDSSFTATKKTRGNVTATTQKLIQANKDINTYQQYDVAGNVLKVIDPEGHATTFTFTDNFGAPSGDTALAHTQPAYWLGTEHTYAFPTQVKNTFNQIIYTQYDYYTGKPVNAKDTNGTVYSGYYNDLLDRPTQMVSAYADTALRTQTRFIYDDVNKTITTTSDRSTYDDDLLKSAVIYDGLGRTVETRQYEDATNFIKTEQQYDGMRRVSKKSNPYRPNAGETAQWTQTTYDELSRVTQVLTPDGAKVLTSYSGNVVTVRDQANKDRSSTTDALGRLIQVIEDPGTGGSNYETDYTYDVLDNLLTVVQADQTRTFTYDSLKRLTQATNPESGTIKYEYDDTGNLLKKIDPRKVNLSPLTYLETTYAYDALNRVTSKTYNDNDVTSNVLYKYDLQTLPAGAPGSTIFDRGASTGRLVSVTYGGTAAGTYYSYDGLGRVVERVQQTDGTNYEVNATYNRAGAMLTETYPAAAPATTRRVVTHTFDGAGRLASLSTAGAGVTGIQYASHGALSQETYGTLIHKIGYNERLQPTSIQLGTSISPGSKLDLVYEYGTTTNNGNLTKQIITVDATEIWTQTFTYDSLNRLDTAKEVKDLVTQWTQNFDYDQYGNHCIRAAATPTQPCAPAVSPANNRLNGRSYDLAGNQLDGDANHSFTYDAENKIKTVDGASAYVYDGEGNRVRKLLGENLRMIHGIGGQLFSEFDGATDALKKEYIYGANGLAATIEPGVGTRYMTNDPLGSARILTNASGAIMSRHDYQPFGEELLAGMGNRTTAQGYGVADGLRKQFTSKERDDETGLDYFLARYYSSIQGRFTSPDEFTGGPDELFDFANAASDNPTFYADLTNPQSLNKYQYAYNNPLRYVDPNGHNAEGLDSDQGGQGRRKTQPMPGPPNPLYPTVDRQTAEQTIELMKQGAAALGEAADQVVDSAKTKLLTGSIVVLTTLVSAGQTVGLLPAPQTGTPPNQQAQPAPPPAAAQTSNSNSNNRPAPPPSGPAKADADKKRKTTDRGTRQDRKKARQDSAKNKTNKTDDHTGEGPHHRDPSEGGKRGPR
jgi:RHS repeat-associated protein